MKQATFCKLAWMWLAAPTLIAARLAAADHHLPPLSSSAKVHNFAFQSSPNVDFALSTSVVPPEFCDPSSKSLSGYFGVTGSKYDRDRSKRYFYWFFERRSQSMLPGQQTEDSSDDDDEEKIPFVI